MPPRTRRRSPAPRPTTDTDRDRDTGGRFDDAHRLLVEAVEKLATSDDWLAVLTLSRRLPAYSPRNCLLLAAQGAQGLVMGYQAWRAVRARDGGCCQVNRGATSLKILAPITRTVTDTDPATGDEQRMSRLVGFRPASVFDETTLVSPPALPDPAALRPVALDGEAADRLWQALAAQVTAAGYRLDVEESVVHRIAPPSLRADRLHRPGRLRAPGPATGPADPHPGPRTRPRPAA